MANQHAQHEQRPPRRRRSILRRLLVLLLVIALLLGIIAGAAHYVLQSDLPRQIAETQIEQATGLRAQVESVELGWGGTADVRGVQLTTPLEDEPFATIDSLHADLKPLPLVLFGGPGLELVQIDGVDLALRQHPDGQWNVLEALAGIPRDEDAEPAAPTALPRVELTNARITVDDAQGRRTVVDEITLTGEPVGAVAFEFDATAKPGIAASGRIDLRGDQRHRIDFQLESIRTLAHDWVAELDLPKGDFAVGGQWSGRVEDGTLRGRLAVDSLYAGPLSGRGVLQVNAGPDGVGVSVQRWVASLEDLPEQVRVTGGRVQLVNNVLQLRRLELDVMQTQVWITGDWSLADQAGQARLSWSGQMAEMMNLTHDGEATVQLEPVTPTRQRLTATLSTQGSIDAGDWQASAELVGNGPSPQEMTWQFNLPRGRWNDPQRTITLDDTAFELAVAPPELVLRQVRLAGQPVEGTVSGDLDHGTWQADLATQQWRVPVVNLPAAITFALQGEGDAAAAFVRDFQLQMQGIDLQADGQYLFGAERPLAFNFAATVLHALEGPLPDAPLPPNETAPTDRLDARFAGRVAVSGSIEGAVAPLGLQIEGDLHADHLVVNHRRLHDVTTPFVAEVQEETVEGEPDRRITVRTPGYFDLLGGQMGVGARYSLATGTAEVGLDITNIDLSRAAGLAEPNTEVTGAVDASLGLTVPGGDVSQMHAVGDWQATNLRVGDLARLDSAEGELSTRQSLLELNPIVLRYREGIAAGRAEYDLVEARHIRAELNVTRWPVDLEQHRLQTRIDGDVQLNVDAVEASVRGEVDIDADVTFRDREFGRISVDGGLADQALTLRSIEADVLDGRITGNARVDLRNLYASEASLAWQDLDLAAAEQWLVFDEEIAGRVDGDLRVGPARLARAPEPLQIDLRVRPHDETGFRNVYVADSVATMFAGPERYLLQDSSLGLAGGRLRLWAQAVPRDGRWFVHTRANANRLDLDVLNKALDPENNAMIGRLSGDISAFGFADDPTTLAGTGLVRLTESDLAQTRIIGAVYQTMNLNFSDTDPTGSGRVRVRVDSGSLRVEDFQYFNRGVDIYGTATVTDLEQGIDSPLDATLVGTLRPLRGVNLPFASDIDRLLRSLQTVAGSVRVDGTLREPRPQQAALADVQATIERLLGEQQRE